MKALDKNYLSLQFRNKIYSKNGTEFQSFFEDIMEKAFPNFKKIPSGGGDGGNDGWIKETGSYYQVHAPNTPATKDSEAAKKLKSDFQKLKTNWDHISEVKKYYFVFNDKYFGSKKPEIAIAELKVENPDISFEVFLAKNLEKLFFDLSDSDILSLGFNIDQRQALSNAYKYLEGAKTELDRENAKSAQKILKNSEDIILALNDDKLSLEYEILECRCLQKLEKIDKAKEQYKNIAIRYPQDPRSFLYLAEIYLNDKNFIKNQLYLEKAESINKNYWLLKLEQLVRKIHLGKKIETKNINEKAFPNDTRVKSNFYRLHAIFYEDSGEHTKADSFIEKAIHLNPSRFSNHTVKLSISESRMVLCQDNLKRLKKSQELLNEIDKVGAKFFEYGDIGARNKAILNVKKLNAFQIQENYPEFERIAQETFELSLSCYLDMQIEQILAGFLKIVSLPDKDLNQLLEYLKKHSMLISDELSKAIIFQFNIRNSIFTVGKKFFKEINNVKYHDFISDIENENWGKVLEFLKSDPDLAVIIAVTLKNHPELRKKTINDLPDIQKEKLLLLLYFDERKFDEAFEILKNLDLSNLNYFECKPILQVIHNKKAWDFGIIVLQKLLEKETKKEDLVKLKLQLFNAYSKLNKHPEIIELGERLLDEEFDGNILDPQNKEYILSNTIIACLKRGKIEKSAFEKSKELIAKFKLSAPSFEFKIQIEPEIYLNNNDPENALKSIIDGIKIKKVLSDKEYANLYFLLVIKIGEQKILNIESLNQVEENTFLKLRDKERWYFIGDDNELDAIKISKNSSRYQFFIDRKIGDNILFENKYSSGVCDDSVDKIFSIEKYVLWQTIQNFQKLSIDGDLEGVQIIKNPQKEETVDFENLLNFLEDIRKGKEPFFKMYCNNNYPLSTLAVNEGGITNAIGRIQQENKGFINFSSGTIEEFEKQKKIARKVIEKKEAFYIDGTSALFLSEIGLFQKIHSHLQNFKVPQSVINMLADIADKFGYSAGQVGSMGFAQGKIFFSSVEKEKRDLIKSNLIASIKILEFKPENIGIISSANKIDCFSEKTIPSELCDACILAQKEGLPILTEDYLYLSMNQVETKKNPPEYFSSLALLRVLCEDNKISFNEYLKFFGYLSSYRFRFLALSSDDIEKAVFGHGEIKTVNLENIRQFNFPLTLSEEYGVLFQDAFKVLGSFLYKVLVDNNVTVEIAEKIFMEILFSFPSNENKKNLGQMLLRYCLRIIEKNKSEFILYPENQLRHKKFDRLRQATEIYAESKIWVPN